MEMLSYHGLSKEDEAGIKEFLAGIQVFMLERRISTDHKLKEHYVQCRKLLKI